MRVLIWHVHGSWATSFVAGDHDYLVPVTEDRGPDDTLVTFFGLPALSGRAANSIDVHELEAAIRDAIVEFEPRILAATLQVRAILEASALDHHNVIGVEIHGQLWAQPVPLELLVRTEIDLETGKVEMSDLLPSRVV